MLEKPFVHLHCHSDYSLLDGCAKVEDYMIRCRELNMPAVAMTDHGNLFGAISFYRAARKADIKPIIGCEIYLVHDHNQAERPKRDKQRSDDIDDIPDENLGPDHFPKFQIHHKTVLAKDFTGYQNLVKLVSDAHVNGMYYRPRTDMDKLAAHAKGLIGLSGCMNGVAAQHLLYNNYEMAREVTGQFVDIFGRENYFIEVHNHGLAPQSRILPGLLRLAREFDLPVVCANDVHYVRREDWQPHDSLLCIQTGKILSEPQRMRYPNQEFYLKSYSEMARVFQDIPEALENTLRVAEIIDLELKFGEDHYPVYESSAEITPSHLADDFDRILDIYVEEKNKVLAREGKENVVLTNDQRQTYRRNGLLMMELCVRGLWERYRVDYEAWRGRKARFPAQEAQGPARTDEICRQFEYEIAIITGTGFVDYFLITWDFIDWARQQGIPVGPGRGSGTGCLVSYILRITDIDPLRFGLIFERMLNLERVSPPDFDVDFCMRRRDEVVEYVRKKYGSDRVANIITYGKFGAKMVVRDLARVMDVPYTEANRIAKMVPDDLNITLDRAIGKSQELAEEIRRNPVVSEIVMQGKVIEGMVRNTGKHACGIIISDQPLTELVPVTLQEGDLTTQYAKGPVEDLGLLKCDFLGLKTLTVISDAQENVRRTTGNSAFDIEYIPLDDEKTYTLLNSGRTTGVFQLESGGMQALCRQIGLSTFEEIIALIALYRPGPMQFIDQYVRGKRDPATVQVPHPLLENLVRETYGVLVYQEQVMEAARIIAGYSLGGADILRRAMGKKIRSIMEQQKEVFVTGAREKNNIDRRTAENIFALLEKFAEYGFNKSHSAAYAMLSYRTAYLKANFPVEFMAAVLGCESGNADKVAHFIEECSAMDLPVLGPDVNESRETFTPVVETGRTSIRFGLGAIKGVGDAAAQLILQERAAAGRFLHLDDFLRRMDGRQINRRVLECLIKAGAFDSCGESRGQLLQRLDTALSAAAAEQRDRAAGQESFLDLLADNTPLQPATETSLTSDLTTRERLQFEKELLGFYVSGHPLDPYRGLLEAVNSFALANIAGQPDRVPFRLCGVAGNVSKKFTRKDNRMWAVFSLGSREGSIEINMFPDDYDACGHLLLPETPLIVTGMVAHRGGETKLSARVLQPLETSLPGLIHKITWVLDAAKPHHDFLRDLHDYAMQFPGETHLELALAGQGNYSAVAGTAMSLRHTIQPATHQKLRRHPAVLGCLLQTKTIALPDRSPAWSSR